MIDNWRWAGVPFYLRTGKRLKAHATEVALEFKEVPHLPFMATNARELGPNLLVVRVQPDEGITLRFGAKVPGQEFNVRSVNMDFSYAETFTEHVARGVRAPAARRADRRPDVVHPLRRSAPGVAHLRPDPRRRGTRHDAAARALQGRHVGTEGGRRVARPRRQRTGTRRAAG